MPMCFLRARPIGVMQMLDQGEQDDKVRVGGREQGGYCRLQCHAGRLEGRDGAPQGETLRRRVLAAQRQTAPARPSVPQVIAVHADDPEFKHFSDISQLPAHRLAEIRRFFEDYKKVGGGRQGGFASKRSTSKQARRRQSIPASS